MRLVDWLLDLLFPPKCPFCRRLLDSGKDLLCPKCQRDLPWAAGAQGEKPVEFLDRCAGPLWYRENVRHSHHRYKFSGLRCYARPYGLLMAQCALDRLGEDFDVVCWAPLSRKRLRKRGYDQSKLLAEVVAHRLILPADSLLEKVRDTAPQSGQTDAAARRANILGAYRLRPGKSAEGMRILLVDDVVTTGATLSECARVLRTAGAEAVSAVVLALTPEQK
ncbi:MAG: ComF family protein [Ruminococcaceae bacterium]|nr:ComF family protein [Oscillospiraceae bacterium]